MQRAIARAIESDREINKEGISPAPPPSDGMAPAPGGGPEHKLSVPTELREEASPWEKSAGDAGGDAGRGSAPRTAAHLRSRQRSIISSQKTSNSQTRFKQIYHTARHL